jgi:transcriptional regulator with XRE-family HTH domain
MKGGDLILMARRRARLTQRELAGRIECRQATIARWERGDRHPSYEDVQAVAGACGLQLDVHLLTEDRSWWPQIATQLDRTPVQRVRGLIPRGASRMLTVLETLAESRAPVIVIGEVAGALHGWPLVFGADAVEICARAKGTMSDPLDRPGADSTLAGTRGLLVTEIPPGTAGFRELTRGAETIEIDRGSVRVAGLLDLLRIADASPRPDAARHALAYRAVLDVQRARRQASVAESRSDEERIQEWLSRQTPVA